MTAGLGGGLSGHQDMLSFIVAQVTRNVNPIIIEVVEE